MSRLALVVRDAVPEDAAALVKVWAEAGSGASPAPPVEEAAKALAQVAAGSEERLIVGEVQGQVVAALHLRRGAMSPIQTEQVVFTTFMLVLPEFRRHGFAHALLECAVAWAEEKDIAHVAAVTASNSRDTNRYLARLGLGTVATLRLAPTPILRGKLSPERHGGKHLGAVLAQRRSMRRRQEAAQSSQPA